MENQELDRRTFLKALAAGAATVTGFRLAKSVSASSGPDGESAYSWAMVIDQSKCEGCGYCIQACRARNNVSPDISWTRVIEMDEICGEPVYLPRPCQHCEKAPCVEACPVKASVTRSDGIVMMDYDRCIGCRYCEVACPYGARAFNWEEFTGPNPAVPQWGMPEVERRPRGVVEKCSFCYQRIDRGLTLGLEPGVDEDATPACVVSCPVCARKFGNLKDPDSEVSRILATQHWYRLREDLGTAPRIYYLPAAGRCPDDAEA